MRKQKNINAQNIIKLLEHKSSIQIINLLRDQKEKIMVAEISWRLKMQASTASITLTNLHQIGVVKSETEGLAKYYTLCPRILEQYQAKIEPFKKYKEEAFRTIEETYKIAV